MVKVIPNLARVAVAALCISSLVILNYSSDKKFMSDIFLGIDAVKDMLNSTIGFGHLLNSSADDKVWPELLFSFKVVLASILGVFGAAFGSAGGIGGGPLFVPIFNLLLGYDAKTSAALSKAMIFGVAISSLLFNIRLRHPDFKNQPLIDYDIVLFVQPMLLLGISLGVIFNVVLPTWVLKSLLVGLLFFVSYKTTLKGIATWEKEAADSKTIISFNPSANEDAPIATEDEAPEVSVWRLIKWGNVLMLCFIWLLYLIIQITVSRVQKCGSVFWISTAAQVVVSAVFTVWAIKWLSKKPSEANEPLIGQLGSPVFSPEKWKYVPLVTVVAGVAAGLLGVSGALVMGPIFLELEVHPQSSTATSAFMILFSSSMSVVEFYLVGRIPLGAASYFFLVGFFAAIFGLSIVRAVVTWSKKASIVVFVLAFFVGISGLVIFITGSSELYSDWIGGKYMGMSSFCS